MVTTNIRVNHHHVVMTFTGDIRDHRLEVQALVRDVHRNDAVGLEVPVIDREGLAREQVDRGGVAVESIQGEQVELLRGLPFERQAPIAQCALDFAGAVGQVSKWGLGKTSTSGLIS